MLDRWLKALQVSRVTVPRPLFLPLLMLALLAIGTPALYSQETTEAPAEAATPAAESAPEPEAAPAPEPASKPAKRTARAKEKDEEDERPARRRTAARPTPASTPAATPEPKRPGFIRRLFGAGRQPAATPMATPMATPKPAPRKPRKVDEDDDEPKKRDSQAGKKPAIEKDPEDKPETEKKTPPSPDKPETKPENEEAVTEKPKPTPRGRKGAITKKPVEPTTSKTTGEEQKALDAAVASGDATAIEKAKYNLARAKAVEDGEVRELKAKADAATSDEEGRKTLRAYNKALFDKMRQLDPSISERADRIEAAVIKRLE